MKEQQISGSYTVKLSAFFLRIDGFHAVFYVDGHEPKYHLYLNHTKSHLISRVDIFELVNDPDNIALIRDWMLQANPTALLESELAHVSGRKQSLSEMWSLCLGRLVVARLLPLVRTELVLLVLQRRFRALGI